ncbi:MAG: glycosyltransferase WbuB [Chloroflexi bacterium]|nr:MAG: glycosyltransferase WbuB [Chloroflexota bacterium]
MTDMHITMLLTNPFRPDPRVHKEARSLTRAGYRVTVICWDRQGEFPPLEQIDGFEVRRLVVPSGYGVGSRQALYLPRFWLLALKELYRLRPDIIHCHDLDTTPAGYWYARTHRLPWLFDAHEAYPEATVELRVNRLIYHLLVWLERFMTRRASHVITVGNLIAQRFQAMGGRVSVVGNYQPLQPVDRHLVVTRADLGLPADAYVVAYIGGFNRARAIVPLMEATTYAHDVTVLLVGDGPQRPDIEARLPQYPRVRYLGWVPQAQVPDYTRLADVIYYGLLGDDLNNHYSSPNALFNALMAGRPLITTNIGEVARIVQTGQCGLVLESPTPQAIANAIDQLRDRFRRETMATNARRAAETTYNWAAAEAVLLKIYRNLIPTPVSRQVS